MRTELLLELCSLEREIKRLREQRKKQFLALKLFERCEQIAKHLGRWGEGEERGWQIYIDGELKIRYCPEPSIISVYYRGKQVLRAEVTTIGMNLEFYRPGKWLGRVIELSEKLAREREEREYQRRKQKLLEELKKWEVVSE